MDEDEIAQGVDYKEGDYKDDLFWMEEVPKDPSHPAWDTIDALNTLIEPEGQTPEEYAEQCKYNGNMHFKDGKDYYHDALHFYTQAIEAKSSIVENNAIYHCNRALVQYKLGNYRKCLQDILKAISLNLKHMKSYYIGIQAALPLKEWKLLVEFAEVLFQYPEDSKEFKMAKATVGKMEKQLAKERAKKEAAAQQEKLEDNEQVEIRAALEQMGFQLGHKQFDLPAGKLSERRAFSVKDIASVEEGVVYLNIFFIYEEVGLTDLLTHFHPSTTLSDLLSTVFATPASWDTALAYEPRNLLVYYEVGWTKPIDEAPMTDAECVRARKRVKVDKTQPLSQILAAADYIIPGIPAFYIIPKHHRDKFLHA